MDRGPGLGRTLASIALSVAVLAIWATAARATTITVNYTTDLIANDGHCSLREAITAANSDAPSGAMPGECAAGGGTDLITVPAGQYVLSNAGKDEEGNATGDLDVTSSLTIQGAGAATTIIDGDASVLGSSADRVFDVHGTGTVATIAGVTITDGSAPSGSIFPQGGGIWNNKTLTLDNDIVTGNQTADPNGNGGGIFNSGTGTLTLNGTTVSLNHTSFGNTGGRGGGIWNDGTLVADLSTFSANTANGNRGPGGGVVNNGTMTLTNSVVSANQSGAGTGGGGDGGGIANLAGMSTISGTTFSDNHAADAGFGSGSLTGGGGGALAVKSGSVVLTNDTLSGNQAGAGENSSSQGGNGGDGGGVLVDGGTLTATNVTVASNAAGAAGTGPTPGLTGVGGGIAVTSGSATLNGSLLAGNTLGNCAGAVADAGYDLSFGGTGCPPTFLSGDPLLGPLQDNGGPTLTRALDAGSAALDQIPVGAGCPGTDQRGIARPQGPFCDIGAFERVVPSPTGGGGATKATISSLRETNSTFAVGPSSTPLTGKTAAKRHKRGTVFSFRLDQPATVTIAIRTKVPGRRVGQTCRAPSPKLRHHRACKRTITNATLNRSAHAGLNSVPFSGRLRGKTLRPARYQAVFTATTAAGASPSRKLRFRIVRR